MGFATIAARPSVEASSAIGEREFGSEGEEGAGEDTAHPRQHPRPRDDMAAQRGGAEPVADEDDEGQQHEDGAEPEHARERIGVIGAPDCGRKARKKIDNFGLRMLIRIAETITCRVDSGSRLFPL